MKKLLCVLLGFMGSLSAVSHHFEVGPQSSNLAIKQNAGPGKSVGWITGARLEYEYQNKLYANGYVEKSWGSVKDYFIQDVWAEGTLGYVCSFKGKRLIPYAGLGYQYFKQNQNFNGVTLSTRHPYVPVGLYLEADVTPAFSLGFNIKGLFPLKTLDHVGGFQGSYWQLQPKKDLVLEWPVMFHKETNSGTWGFSAIPYYRVIRFGPSCSVNSLGVPVGIHSQRNRYIGGRVMLTYAF